MRSSIALVVLLLCPLACAHGSTVQKLEFDTYRIACTDAPLDGCLHEAANNACDKRAYFVVRGISDVNSRGTSESPWRRQGRIHWCCASHRGTHR